MATALKDDYCTILAAPCDQKQRGSTLNDIAVRATARRANPNLRHMPNEADLRTASENARLMAQPQYQTIKEDNA